MTRLNARERASLAARAAKMLPHKVASQIAAIAGVRPGRGRVQLRRALSQTVQTTWIMWETLNNAGPGNEGHKRLRAGSLKPYFDGLRRSKSPIFDLETNDLNKGASPAENAARSFVAAVLLANPKISWDDAIERAGFLALKNPDTGPRRTRLPARGRGRGTSGSPGFDTFCARLMANIEVVGGTLTAYRTGTQREVVKKKTGLKLWGSDRWRGHKQENVSAGERRGSFIKILDLLTDYLPPGFVPTSNRAVVDAFKRAEKSFQAMQ